MSRKETGGIRYNATQSRKTSVVHETPNGMTNGAIMVRIYRLVVVVEEVVVVVVVCGGGGGEFVTYRCDLRGRHPDDVKSAMAMAATSRAVGGREGQYLSRTINVQSYARLT